MCKLIFYVSQPKDEQEIIFPTRSCALHSRKERPVRRRCLCYVADNEWKHEQVFSILLNYLLGQIREPYAMVTKRDLETLRKHIRQYMIDQDQDLNV
jgi:hypothetical protein